MNISVFVLTKSFIFGIVFPFECQDPIMTTKIFMNIHVETVPFGWVTFHNLDRNSGE